MTTRHVPVCPVCQERVDADEAAFEYHVSQHFDSCGADTKHGSSSRQPEPPIMCPVCDELLTSLDEGARTRHVTSCLDVGQQPEAADGDMISAGQSLASGVGQSNGDPAIDPEWDGPARPGGWTDWVDKKVASGDKWWDPVSGVSSDIPSNFSPGLMPVLYAALEASVALGSTRAAVLARDTVHIRSAWKFDIGWGCGYRNALMALSALLMAKPEYRPLFDKKTCGANPGVRRIQGWIEEAWQAGYDLEGREQLKKRVLGTRKWIGTTDLYAMFTAKGVPSVARVSYGCCYKLTSRCKLWDFPKPKDRMRNAKSGVPTHHILQQWVRRYFAEDVDSNGSAFDVLMRPDQGGSGRGEAVRVSSRLPMILQHNGHSRTIVGYEETGHGDVNLLLFDPGRSVPKDARETAIAGLGRARSGNAPKEPPVTTRFSPPYTNGASVTYDLVASPTHSTKRSRAIQQAEVGSDEEVDSAGWVRKKAKGVVKLPGRPADTLGVFRVNLSRLSAHAAYQVLVFTGGPVMSDEERRSKRVIGSVHVCE